MPVGKNNHSVKNYRLVGQGWLREHFDLDVPPPQHQSFILQKGAKRTDNQGEQISDFYPPSFDFEDNVINHLRFSLKNEILDVRILALCMAAIDPAPIESWCLREPTSAYARRAWFFYEWFTGRRLNLEDVSAGNYRPALDPKRYFVAGRVNSPRHRIIDNMLGTPALCVIVRRTDTLTQWLARDLNAETRKMIATSDPAILSRAISYLYTRETRSSFAIEGERPSAQKEERFMEALRGVSDFEPTKENLVALQNEILDSRYVPTDWRDFQNFIGQTGYADEQVHFICPKPEDVASLMEGWFALYNRLNDGTGEVHPVIMAAILAFCFVFIHPFEDGNGRTHRYLIHAILARLGFGPQNFIFPISSSIVRDRRGYEERLESFSQPIMHYIDREWGKKQTISVKNDTKPLYQYFDATVFAEYLFSKMEDTIKTDLHNEINFLVTFEKAIRAIGEIVDMPDKRAALLAKCLLGNEGVLSKRKREEHFSELTDGEIAAIEKRFQSALLPDTDRT
ncbi:Fic family protein [Acetobacteraceae bacterium ESL0709]|nr:Fic family protein [Acetobacteraceae bacterium ESL0697]MDF7677439.1 Fic family protein [Acetobacteraceae bacterium ESL0709]